MTSHAVAVCKPRTKNGRPLPSYARPKTVKDCRENRSRCGFLRSSSCRDSLSPRRLRAAGLPMRSMICLVLSFARSIS